MKEKELKEIEKGFQVVLDMSPCALYLETQGRFSYVNRSALELLGAGTPEELIGMEIRDRVHPNSHTSILAQNKEPSGSGNPVAAQREVYIRLDGLPVEVEVSQVPFHFHGNDAILVFLHDISQKKNVKTAGKENIN
jgi:PAS domain S-box-containing protein